MAQPPSTGSTSAVGQASTGATSGVGEGTANAPARRSARGSTLPIRGGKREVKAYAVTEDELSTLGALQVLAALFFSLAGLFFGLWFDISLQVAFAEKHDAAVHYWKGLQSAALIGAILFAVIGVGIFLFNGSRVRKIKKATTH